MKCPNCGAENDSKLRFCEYCGTELPHKVLRPNQTYINNYYVNPVPPDSSHLPPDYSHQVQQFIPPSYHNYAPPQVYNEAYVPCERCGGRMLPQTVTEMKKRSIFTILWWLFLTAISAGIIPIISLIRGRKSRTVTYMVCQRCGHRVDSKRLKAWK